MSVVILKWNPGVSSWSNYDHVKRIVENNKNSDSKMNWSVWEYDKVKKGDKCFLLKVGYGANGIVDAGVILSKPYKSDGAKFEFYKLDKKFLQSSMCLSKFFDALGSIRNERML